MSAKFRDKLLDPNKTAAGTGVVADSAFPVSGEMIGLIITPLKAGDLARASPELRDILEYRSEQITSLRQAAEWGMGSAEKCFRILTRPLPFNQETRGRRLRTVYRLYNYRVRTTGISQIRNSFLS
jgi:hypothetical protein